MRHLRFCGILFLSLTGMLFAQNSAPARPAQTPAASELPADLQTVVKKQFGSGFTVAATPGNVVMTHITHEGDLPWTPLLIGDLDGDGIEDAAIVVRGKDPIGAAAQFDYKVFDPVNSYFGWGDPKETSTFNADDIVHNLMVLVIHGAGKEGWRAENPKAKFVLINLSFDRLSLSGATLKKKPVAAMRVEESNGVASLVFWDGKKYKYLPGAAGGG